MDLLPCPFCGETQFAFSEGDRQVKCAACNACGPEVTMVRANWPDSLFSAIQKTSIEAWNKRASSQPAAPSEALYIEAGSITIGDKDGLHVIIDSNGQRIRNGEEQLWP